MLDLSFYLCVCVYLYYVSQCEGETLHLSPARPGRDGTGWGYSADGVRVRQASLACPNLPHVIVQWISSACSPVKPASLAWSFLIRSPDALLLVWQTSLWACSIIINSTFKISPFRIHHSLISLASAHFGVLPGPGVRGGGIMSQPCSVNKSPC